MNIFAALLFVQERHAAYFKGQETTIMDYLSLSWGPVRVCILDRSMPSALKKDIEELIIIS